MVPLEIRKLVMKKHVHYEPTIVVVAINHKLEVI
jgi:hypothetical protein